MAFLYTVLHSLAKSRRSFKDCQECFALAARKGETLSGARLCCRLACAALIKYHPRMTLRSILLHPDSRLKKICDPIESFDSNLTALIEDMFETMYDAPGVGLAGPQIGVMSRVFVMDCAGKEEVPQPLALINPQIIRQSEELSEYEEGCLSIPEHYASVTRPAEVEIRYQTPQGAFETRLFCGLEATCAQHELDHLNGILFIDHISAIRRRMITEKMRKFKREQMRQSALKS